jgi:hypothetical protein
VPWTGTLQSSDGAASSEQGQGSTKSVATDTISVTGPGLAYNGQVQANASGSVSPSIHEATSLTGGNGAAAGTGPLSVTELSLGNAFYKGGAGISKSESVLLVTIEVNGKPYVVAEEVALALARNTQFGTAGAALAGGSIASLPAGYVSGQIVSSKGTSRP